MTVDENLSIITIDPSDIVTIKNGKGETREPSQEEIFEHELGHASDMLGFTKSISGDRNTAIKFENEFRRKKGIDFKRTDPGHRIK